MECLTINSIHDLGGMTCFGPIEREADEPVFHSDWERRAFALNMAAAGLFGPIDRLRHASERMNPVDYLATSYYEHWLAGIETIGKEMGVLSDEEIATGIPASSDPASEPPPNAEMMAAFLRQGVPATRDTGRLEPRFSVGQRVRTRNINPSGHTRLPRYVRGHVGLIERIHGTHIFPDTNAHDQGENPQPLYSLRFDATELWGPKAPRQDRLYIDLWEDYLEPEAD